MIACCSYDTNHTPSNNIHCTLCFDGCGGEIDGLRSIRSQGHLTIRVPTIFVNRR